MKARPPGASWTTLAIPASAALALSILLGVLLAACGADAPGKPVTTQQSETSDAVGDGRSSALPTTLPGDFTIRAYQGADVIGGETVELSNVVGQGRPVVLNFWGGLCPPCRAEMPAFQRTHERFGDRVLLLGVDVGPFVGLGSRQDAKDLIAELGVTYPNGWTFNSRALKDFKLYGIPVTWFFNSDGTVYRVWNGAIPETELARIVEDLVSRS